jgi:hypothetical protein
MPLSSWQLMLSRRARLWATSGEQVVSLPEGEKRARSWLGSQLFGHHNGGDAHAAGSDADASGSTGTATAESLEGGWTDGDDAGGWDSGDGDTGNWGPPESGGWGDAGGDSDGWT